MTVVVNHEPPYSSIHSFSRALGSSLDIPVINSISKHYYLDGLKFPLRKLDGNVIMADPFVGIHGNKTITVYHDLGFYEWEPATRALLFSVVDKVVRSEKVFVSQHTREFYKKLRKSDGGTVIYPYVLPEIRSMNLDRSDFILMDFAMSSGARKNPQYHEKMVRDNPKQHFIKIGNGKFSCEYDNVEYKTKLSMDEVNYLYNKAKEVWWFTLDEGFGSPMAQAMMTKTPIRLLDTEINREIYGDLQDRDVDRKFERINGLVDPRKLTNQWKTLLEGLGWT